MQQFAENTQLYILPHMSQLTEYLSLNGALTIYIKAKDGLFTDVLAEGLHRLHEETSETCFYIH